MAWASILNLQRMGLSRGRENVVYWCIPLFLLFTFSLVSFLIFLSFLLFFPCIPLFSILSCLPLASSFTIHGCPLYIVCHCGIYPFCPSTVFGSLWPSLQDYLPTCRLSNHYLCLECVGCTTLHFQTKLLVLFLTPLCSCFTHMDKNKAIS